MRKASGFPLWAVLTVLGGSLVGVSLAVGAGVAGWVWWKGAKSVQSSPPAKKTFTREEVKHAWNYQRTRLELEAVLGKPDATTEVKRPWRVGGPAGGSGYDTVVAYHYYNFSVDSEGSGKVDRETIVYVGSFTPPDFIP